MWALLFCLLDDVTLLPQMVVPWGKKGIWARMRIFQSSRWYLLILFMSIVFGMSAFYALQRQPGIQVTVQNAGDQELKSLACHVTGRSYQLGDLPPGRRAQVTVRSTSESHLEISFVDTAGSAQRLDAGGYLEPNYRGSIQVSIRDGKLAQNDHAIRLW